jgi:hypothetical protein
MNATQTAVTVAKLPLPNPEEWLTRGAAAVMLGVDPATVSRMAADGRLRSYSPVSAPEENAPIIMWLPEVAALAEARRIAKEGVR